MPAKEFTREEVAKHDKHGDLWVIIDTKVYDLSKFAALHPGGVAVLTDNEVAGKDATDVFFGLHRHEVLLKYPRLQIGVIAGEEQQIIPRATDALSTVPYAEPTWLTPGYYSPYYNESHRRVQVASRKFVEEIIIPDAHAREADGKRPSPEILKEIGRQGIIAMRMGPGPHLKGRVLMDGVVEPEEFDSFHDMLMGQEIGRLNARGYIDGLGGGIFIGLPAIMNFGKAPLHKRIVKEVLAGEKVVCLCISEAFAGSDVAGLKCLAKKVENGWRITGTKKWITSAVYAEYFVVGCRTEDGGLVVLVAELQPGIEVKPIKTTYSSAAGTGYVTFEDVFVPDENILGTEYNGLIVILSNFNHERWGMCCNSVGAQRFIVEECLKWAVQRQIFGKPLASQAVVRAKLAAMISRVECAQNWLENITYQMTKMNYKQQSTHLAGQIALLKKHCTQTAQDTARDAVQIFGGRGITTTGMGRFIEHYHRTVVFDAVLGGAEDVLGDLGVRQALRKMPQNTRL